jgi:two-component sensor histidine kinase
LSSGAQDQQTVLLLAPLGRDADVACEALTRAKIGCRPGRDLTDLNDVSLECLGALVVTEELLTGNAVERLARLLDTQPTWSSLRVILLVNPEHRRTTNGPKDHLDALGTRRGVILIQRPMHAPNFVSVARAALDARQRQFQLRDELEARRSAEARARILADEMKHRVKNAYALAISIASQTFRGANSLDEARKAFSGRLTSMARAQDLLTAEGDDKIEFRHLVDQATEPYRSAEKDPFDLAGPQVAIPARKATAFAMAFHELSTNAMKYGALASPSGRITIWWRIEPAADDTALLVEWRERGGPPVSPPQRRGFGSLLVEQALAQDLDGTAELDFDSEGVACTIRAALNGEMR